MRFKRFAPAASLLILGSIALAWQAAGPATGVDQETSITGVRSEAAGSAAEEEGRPEGLSPLPQIDASENVVQVVSSAEGSIQSIRGIKGIDSVMLQNLETVLRMQEPPPPPEGGGGGGRAAAALLTMEDPQDEPLEVEADARAEHMEFEIEGS